MTKYEKVYQEKVNEYKEKNLKELATKLRDLLSILASYTDDPFLVWCLTIAPFRMVNVNSEVKTMAAGSDGIIYINPAFYSTLVTLGKEYGDAYAEVYFGIMHEALHLLFGHINQDLSNIHYNNNLPYKKEFSPIYHQIANVSMDYIINNYCIQYFPSAFVMKEIGISEESHIKKALQEIPLKKNFVLSNQKKATEMSWIELYSDIISCIDWDKIQKKMQQQGQDQSQSRGQDQGQSRGRVRGVHGEIIDTNEVVDVRTNGVKSNEYGEESFDWEKAKEEIVARLKQAGYGQGFLFRALEKALDPKISWRVYLKHTILKEVAMMSPLNTWSRLNKRYNKLPGTQFEDKGTLWILGDTSGSMSSEDLATMTGTAYSYIRDKGEVVLVPWDKDVYKPYKIRSLKDLKQIKELEGGGGTVLEPALQWVIPKLKDGDIVFIHTDSYIADFDTIKNSDYMKKIFRRTRNPILWFNTDNANISFNEKFIKVINKREILHGKDVGISF